MEGLSRLAGVGPSLVMAGERFVVRALRLKDYALFEAEILARAPYPLMAVRGAWQVHGDAGLLGVCCDAAVEVAFEAVDATWDQYHAWRQTTNGRLTVLWCSLDRPAWEWFRGAVELECRRDFMFLERADQAIAQANGFDDRGHIDSVLDERSGDSKRVEWAIVYRRLHDNGLSADEIGEATLRQALGLFLRDEKNLWRELTFDTRGEVLEYAARVKRAKTEIRDALYRECR